MNKAVKNLIFILILGSVAASLLLGIRAYTLPIIQRYEEQSLKRTVLEAAGIHYAEDQLEQTFRDKITKEERDGQVYYVSPDGLYIFEFEGRGLWGMIKGLISLRSDLETIDNIKVIAQEETPGLGGRIAEEAFLKQFQRKRFAPELILTLRRKAVKETEVDAISGASLTSKAFVEMINKSGKSFRRRLRRRGR
jgi:Na+-transporting NADH:ubiquinone oxidoreductase subunit C